MVGVRPAVSIDDDVRPHLILIRPGATLNDGRSVDAEWHVGKNRGLEDALRTDKRNPVSVEIEPSPKHLVWQQISIQERLFRQEPESGQSHATVEIVHFAP